MSTLLSGMTQDDIRSICRSKIESLEHWLRRLIEDTLVPVYGDYFSHVDIHGNRLIRLELCRKVEGRFFNDPQRYPRKIDGILLDEAIDIICKLYKQHFQDALHHAFPEGAAEARTFLKRISGPRNPLAHANPISNRDAERVICYCNDVIDSIKHYHQARGMHRDFNVPLIFKFTDSFGQECARAQCQPANGGIMRNFAQKSYPVLRAGEILTVEVDVDPSFDPNEYDIAWSFLQGIFASGSGCGRKANIFLEDHHVGETFNVQCRVTTKKGWHRLGTHDDILLIYYKVLPPIEDDL